MDSDLVTLPVRMGGIGLLSFAECAPLARTAAVASADTMLSKLFPSVPPPGPFLSQHESCQQAFAARRDSLLRRIQPSQRLWIEESASKLGRRWLTIIPYTDYSLLDDPQISAGLHLRTLPIASRPVCASCATPLDDGHVDNCRHRSKSRFIYRHELVKHTLGRTLKSLPASRVEYESPIRRSSYADYDVSVHSVFGAVDLNRLDKIRTGPAESPTDPVLATARRSLEAKAHEERVKQGPQPAHLFHTFIISPGGLLEESTSELLSIIKSAVGRMSFDFLLRDLSVGLLKVRAGAFLEM